MNSQISSKNVPQNFPKIRMNVQISSFTNSNEKYCI